MLAAAALLLAAAAPQTASADAAALLARFDSYCATLDSLDAISGRIEATGWARFTPEAKSDLGKLLSFNDGKTGDLPGWAQENRAFAAGADPSLVAIVTTAGVPGQHSLECRVISLDAASAPADAAIEAWARRAPTTAVADTGVKIWQWEPGLHDGQRITGIAFVAKDSPFRSQLPLLGLVAQAMRDME